MKYSVKYPLLVLFVLMILSASARSAPLLSLDAFLQEVRTGNQGFKGAALSSQAGMERSTEGNLILAPTFFTNYNYINDSKAPLIPLYNYDTQNLNNLSVGVSQLTDFGLQAKIHYDFFETNYVNLQVPSFGLPAGATPTITNPIIQTTPTLELSQSFWGNGFGAGTRATRDLLEAAALSSSFNSSYQAKTALADAETTYWRLANDRQEILMEEQALDRAQKIYEWATRRERLHLGDRSDTLQAQAALKLRALDMQSTLDETRQASLAFNSSRNLDSDLVPEILPSVSAAEVLKLSAPLRIGVRDDVKAAEQNQKAVLANSFLSQEKNSGTFNVLGSIALNGRAGDVSTSLSNPFSAGKPTAAIGFQFSVPIDPLVYKGIQEGWAKERRAAEMTYERKLFEQETTWSDLTSRLKESRRRLDLAHTIESIQGDKLTHEKRRLTQGRTTAYQVLVFEQDFITSQIARVRSQNDVLTTLAQMKLFGDQSL